MRTCDTVCQNRCRMQGRYVVEGCSNNGCVEQSILLHSIPLSPINSTRNEKKTKEVRLFVCLCLKNGNIQYFKGLNLSYYIVPFFIWRLLNHETAKRNTVTAKHRNEIPKHLFFSTFFIDQRNSKKNNDIVFIIRDLLRSYTVEEFF